jgi:hypothetical protein
MGRRPVLKTAINIFKVPSKDQQNFTINPAIDDGQSYIHRSFHRLIKCHQPLGRATGSHQ